MHASPLCGTMAGGDNGPKHFCGDEKKNNEVTSNV